MASPNHKALTVILGLAAVTGGSLAAWQHFAHARELEAVRREAQRAADHWRALAESNASESNRAPQAQPDEARPASPPPAAGAPDSAPGEQALPPPPDNDRTGDRERRRREMAEFMQRPEIVRLRAIQERGAVEYKYASLFRKLKLNPEVQNRLQALLLDRQTTMRDLSSVAREQGLNPRENRDKIRALAEESNREIDQQIANLLGPEQYASYQNYEQTEPQRQVLNMLNQRMGSASSTLTDSQSMALVNAMRAQPSTESARNRVGQRSLAGLNENVINQVQSFLTPDQVTTLRKYLAEAEATEQINALMRQQFERRSAQPGDTGVVPGVSSP